MASSLTVKNVVVAGNRLTINFSCEGRLRKYFLVNEFFAEYSTSIETVPEEILVIPFLASVCPVAWANQADIHVETVDKNFLKCLPVVRRSLQTFYPELNLGGNFLTDKVSEPQIHSQPKSMMLFSGGVDSLATYIRHRNENLTLVAVHGADIDPENTEAWNRAIKSIKDLSIHTKTPLRTVRSNFKHMLDNFMLSGYNHCIQGGGWWGRVMHGLALVGLCAPLAYVDGIEKFYIAATDTLEFQGGWGSHPSIDNNVRWTGTTVFHDGFELSRQQKVQLFADYVKNVNSQVIIRSCWESKKGENCSHCEKCSRTIVGLELAGLDPNKYGFRVNADTFSTIKNNLTNRTWDFGGGEEFHWGDLKNRAYLADNAFHPEARPMIKWLSHFDITSLPSEKVGELSPIGRTRYFFFQVFSVPIISIDKKLGFKVLSANEINHLKRNAE